MVKNKKGSILKTAAEAFIAFKARKSVLKFAVPVIAVSGIGLYLYKKFGAPVSSEI